MPSRALRGLGAPSKIAGCQSLECEKCGLARRPWYASHQCRKANPALPLHPTPSSIPALPNNSRLFLVGSSGFASRLRSSPFRKPRNTPDLKQANARIVVPALAGIWELASRAQPPNPWLPSVPPSSRLQFRCFVALAKNGRLQQAPPHISSAPTFSTPRNPRSPSLAEHPSGL